MAKRYLLPCKECEAKILIETTQAGQTIQCRSCNTAITLGTLRDIKALQPDVAESASSGHVRTGPKMSVGSRLAFVLGTLLLAFGAIWGGMSYLDYQEVMPAALDDERTMVSTNLEKATNAMSAQELLDRWNEMDITAMDAWKEGDYQKNLGLAMSSRNYAYVGFGIAATGLLAIISAFVFKL